MAGLPLRAISHILLERRSSKANARKGRKDPRSQMIYGEPLSSAGYISPKTAPVSRSCWNLWSGLQKYGSPCLLARIMTFRWIVNRMKGRRVEKSENSGRLPRLAGEGRKNNNERQRGTKSVGQTATVVKYKLCVSYIYELRYRGDRIYGRRRYLGPTVK